MAGDSTADVRGGGAAYRIGPAREFAQQVELATLAQARAFVQRHVREKFHLMVLRKLVMQESGARPSTMTDDEVIDAAARLLVQGRWRASVERQVAGGAADVELLEPGAPRGRPAPTPIREKEPKRELTSWIEIELIDEADQPVAGMEYRVRLADGTVRLGKLDKNGCARVERIEAGECEVTFPTLDQDAWEVA
jgi:hypothetical protein